MRNRRRNNWIVIAVVFALTIVSIYQNARASDQAASAPTQVAPKPKHVAPSFQLQTLDGKQLAVGGMREKPLMINFWASWCGPCNTEAPDLVKLYKAYGDKFDLYAVNITPGDSMRNIKAFVERHGYPFPVLLDMEGSVSELYQIQPIPTTFLIDKNGVIRDMFYTESFATLEKKIQKLIDAT